MNLYMNSSVAMETGHGTLAIRQYSNYPWEGKIDIEVLNEKETGGRILLRVPGWARNQPVPSDLFTYEGNASEQPVLLVNGEERQIHLEHGYIPLEGNWKKGDVITLNLPMEVRRVRANELVEEKRGRVAIEYGPVVYCAEEIDNTVPVLETAIGDQERFIRRFEPGLLGGVNVIEGANLKLIPYYAWANREIGSMNVWFPAS
ncbi:MAG: hypothetical protein ACWGNV_12640 [Bacteroidales bacterium]